MMGIIFLLDKMIFHEVWEYFSIIPANCGVIIGSFSSLSASFSVFGLINSPLTPRANALVFKKLSAVSSEAPPVGIISIGGKVLSKGSNSLRR